MLLKQTSSQARPHESQPVTRARGPVQCIGRRGAQGASGGPCLPQVLRRASEGVFVPLTVGGGIRGFTDGDGRRHSALDVAAEYFRSGADKARRAPRRAARAGGTACRGGALQAYSACVSAPCKPAEQRRADRRRSALGAAAECLVCIRC
jgi:hypothetical protein